MNVHVRLQKLFYEKFHKFHMESNPEEDKTTVKRIEQYIELIHIYIFYVNNI